MGVADLALGFVRSPPQSQLSCHQKLPSRSEQLTKAAYPCTQAPSLLATDPPSKSLSVVIPAYNEELRLPATLEETMRYLQQRRAKRPTFTYEVIVVDDGSTDSTSEVAFEYVKRHGVDAVRLLTLRSNKGKGQAVKSGIMCSRGKNVLFMDADGATAIEEVEKLEKKLREGAEETQRVMVVGSRAHMQSAATAKRCVSDRMVSPSSFPHDSIRFDPVRSIYHAPLDPTHPIDRTAVRNFLMHGFHALVTMVVGNEIRDTQCGFKLMTRQAAQDIVPQQRLQRWAFDVELIKLAGELGVRLHEVQVVWTEISGSKVRASSILHIAFELLLIKVGYDVLRVWDVRGGSAGGAAGGADRVGGDGGKPWTTRA